MNKHAKLYVAGPMRGFDHFNFPEFDRVASHLRMYGYEVVNPAEIDRELGLDETLNDLDQFEALGGIEAAMHRDFGAILECDGVALLPGWRHSTGARAEVFVAQMTGRKVYEYVDRYEDGYWAGFWLHLVEDTGVELYHEAPVQATIIGLSGYAQVGKDTLASILVEHHGFERIAFADALRDMLYALNPDINDGPDAGPELRWIVDTYGWEAAKERGARELLQRLGTEAGRNILGEDIWVQTAMKKVKPGGRYVITDCRFPNEARAVEAAGGHVVRVKRPGFEPVNGHPSETALDDWAFAAVAYNVGDPEYYLRDSVKGLLRHLGLPDQAGTMEAPHA
jgi:hypothetical protein